MKDELFAVDLFAGAGGLTRGLHMAGFSSVFANEIHPTYAETYKKNFPDADVLNADIRAINGQTIREMSGVRPGDIALLAGGPPCQGFSINAPIRSLDDERNHLFNDFLLIAEDLAPKAILIENVPGIVSLGKGTVVSQINQRLKRMGYNVQHRILFAGHYGVPQMRFRTVFIAIREDLGAPSFPVPTHNAKAVANFTGAKELCLKVDNEDILLPHTTVWDAMSDLPKIEPGSLNSAQKYASKPAGVFQKLMRGSEVAVHNHGCSRLGAINLKRLKHIPQGGSWRDVPYDLLPAGLKRARRSDHTKRYGRLHPDGLCSTILTKCDPHWGSFFHPTEDRVISVREAARIQSFPDAHIFTGSMTQQYEQVGNAVPPLLGKAIGLEIMTAIVGQHGKTQRFG